MPPRLRVVTLSDVQAVPYHVGELSALDALRPDILIECTGAPAVIADAIAGSGPGGVVCLAGLSSGRHVECAAA